MSNNEKKEDIILINVFRDVLETEGLILETGNQYEISVIEQAETTSE